jgi:hypothetical protein
MNWLRIILRLFRLLAGCLLALFLFFGWVIALLGFGAGVYFTISWESQMQGPTEMSAFTFPIEGTSYKLNVLLPSRVIPGKTAHAEIWITAPDKSDNEIKVTAVSTLPFMLQSAEDIVTLKPISSKNPRPSEKGVFEYDVISINKILPQTSINFIVETTNPTASHTYTVDTLLDSSYTQKAIWIQKIVFILGLVASGLTPMAIGFIFRRR